MTQNGWRKRIERAEELAEKYPFAAEILNFYVRITQFQEGLYRRMEAASSGRRGKDLAGPVSGPPEWSELMSSFVPFLALVEDNGPESLAETARELRSCSQEVHADLLNNFWGSGPETGGQFPARAFFARTFLQPYAEFVRSRAEMKSNEYTGSLCPFCGRKPGLGVLRPQGDGGRRSLICSFCLAEWEFRRIVCPACGEQDHRKLPVYTAEQFEHVRVESCDHCQRYIKTVDLTKTGLAEPVVDELASVPLDLWAREHGYEKLEPNILLL